MLTLALLRHAKSSKDNPAIDDFDRPLNPRGITAAPQAGHMLRQLGFQPDLILCSPARRTRETLDLALPQMIGPPMMGSAPAITFEQTLYHATAAHHLDSVRGMPPAASRILIVGHNPGLYGLALILTGTAEEKILVRLNEGFPTAAIAILEFDAVAWHNIAAASGKLTHFITPRGERD